jgi:hypothetical protein
MATIKKEKTSLYVWMASLVTNNKEIEMKMNHIQVELECQFYLLFWRSDLSCVTLEDNIRNNGWEKYKEENIFNLLRQDC